MKIVADGNIPYVKECFGTIGDVEVFGGREITAAVVRDADVLLVRSVTQVNSRLLEGSAVRFVGTATIGEEHIDIEYLRTKGINFSSAPGSNSNSAAEYVVAGLLEVGETFGYELAGKSIGIIGVGNIGSKVANKCEALGLKVVLNDPPLARNSGDAKYRPIEEIYGCDIVTMHTPLTINGIDKTFHFADEKFFESLKDDCVFINSSRGGIVKTEALKLAIAEGKVGRAINDVWENEPEIDDELLELVEIGTPHIAGYSFDGKINGLLMLYDSVCRFFALAPSFQIGPLLSMSETPELQLDAAGKSEQQLLLEAVKQVYNVREDNSNLWGMLEMPGKSRGKYFDDLRRNYKIRREFGNTRVILKKADASLVSKLEGIGFGVVNG